MAISTSEILDILRARDIVPEELPEGVDLPTTTEQDFPEIGEIDEGETVYSTSIGEVFSRGDERLEGPDIFDTENRMAPSITLTVYVDDNTPDCAGWQRTVVEAVVEALALRNAAWPRHQRRTSCWRRGR